MLTPVSVIVINSITAVTEEYSEKTSSLQSSPDMLNAVSTKMAAPSALISKLIDHIANRLPQFHPRYLSKINKIQFYFKPLAPFLLVCKESKFLSMRKMGLIPS